MPIKWDPGFGWSHQDYEDGLMAFLEAGYTVASFQTFLENNPTRVLILRHDIDFSLEAAVKMARIDSKLAVTSTFFFRVCAKGYNLASFYGLSVINEVRKLGHEIGLHIDPGMETVWGCSEQDALERQFAIFCNTTGEKPIGMSTHEPSRLGGAGTADYLVQKWGLQYHAYADSFMLQPFKYLSDSMQRWRERPFHEYIGEYEQLQVLIHPIWWYENSPQENY